MTAVVPVRSTAGTAVMDIDDTINRGMSTQYAGFRCSECGRQLHRPSSQALGIGPICRRRLDRGVSRG